MNDGPRNIRNYSKRRRYLEGEVPAGDVGADLGRGFVNIDDCLRTPGVGEKTNVTPALPVPADHHLPFEQQHPFRLGETAPPVQSGPRNPGRGFFPVPTGDYPLSFCFDAKARPNH